MLVDKDALLPLDTGNVPIWQRDDGGVSAFKAAHLFEFLKGLLQLYLFYLEQLDFVFILVPHSLELIYFNFQFDVALSAVGLIQDHGLSENDAALLICQVSLLLGDYLSWLLIGHMVHLFIVCLGHFIIDLLLWRHLHVLLLGKLLSLWQLSLVLHWMLLVRLLNQHVLLLLLVNALLLNYLVDVGIVLIWWLRVFRL